MYLSSYLSFLPHHSFFVLSAVMLCCGRALDSPCTLALLVGFQFAFVLYFSLGGFRGLVSVLVHSSEPEFDYSRPHDVYTNLSQLSALLPSHPSGAEQQLRGCLLPSPLLGEFLFIQRPKWFRFAVNILNVNMHIHTYMHTCNFFLFSIFFLLLCISGSCVCAPVLPPFPGGDKREEPSGDPRRPLPSSRL